MVEQAIKRMGAEPLAGLKVVELTWVAMGPYAGYLLNCLGADVIHVGQPESPEAAARGGTRYQELNVGKACVGINLKSTDGRSLMKALLASADVFLENFRPGVIEKLGLGYEELREVNPRLLMVSMSAVGRRAATGNYSGYAPIFAALAGLAHGTGHEDGPPTEIRHPVDLTAGAIAALAVLSGLTRRQKDGKGCYVDLSAREAIMVTLTRQFIEAQHYRCDPGRQGNASDSMAPHGVFPCRGENEWITIAVSDDDAWRKLTAALSGPEFDSDCRYAKRGDRILRRREVEQLVGSWTRQWHAMPLAQHLQSAGVAAFPSMTNKDLWELKHLHEREVFASAERSGKPQWFVQGPWMFNGRRARVRSTRSGEDAFGYVFGELLRLSPERQAALRACGAIGPSTLGF